MDKEKVNKLLPIAKKVLENQFKDGKIPKVYRGYIASFGAAISTGSLLAAVAFISTKSESGKGDRTRIGKMIFEVLKHDGVTGATHQNLFDYVVDNEKNTEENVLNAAIALKLAMNLFTLIEETDSKQE